MRVQNAILAAVGLLETVAVCRPDLTLSRPAWWPAETQWQEALAWSTRLAAGNQKVRAPLATDTQRVSIFTYIQFHSKFSPPPKRYIPFKPLSLDEAVIFPQEKITDAYHALKADLEEGLASLQAIGDDFLYLLKLYDLLQRTAWCLPSPYYQDQEPDISLFDHSRLVAAFMPCFEAATEQAAATLIYGDISGVQDFIYTITARGATSALRGRSVYLQLLTEAIAAYVLDQLELPATNLIYSGGGHFLIVAPAGSESKVRAIQRQVSEKLICHHRSELYLALGVHTFSEKDFQPENFSKAWSQMMQFVNRAKRQRFSELDEEFLYKKLFKAKGAGGGKENECRVCHYEVQDARQIVEEDKEDVEGQRIRKCRLCKSLEKELGDEMRHARYLLLASVPETANDRSDWQAVLSDFGVHARPLQGIHHATLPAGAHSARIWALSDAAFQQAVDSQKGMPILLRYMVNVTPHVSQTDEQASQQKLAEHRQRYPQAPQGSRPEVWTKGNVKPFELIEAHSIGIKRLGVLRMDVDDLGDIFARGFGQGRSDMARTVALSFAMSLYFEGWVQTLAERADHNREVVYSIYSGGDDLFIVGAWDVLPGLAYAIATDLQRYAAGNPHIHASAGITLHGGKYPLYQMAATAANALEAAKDYQASGQRKNAFTFLNRTRPWSDYPAINEYFQHLVELCQPEKAPRRLIQYLVRLDKQYQDHKRERHGRGLPEQPVYWGPWHWHSAYQLTRIAQQVGKTDTETREAILKLRDSLGLEGFSRIELLGLAARWAELFLRKGGEGNGE